MCFASSTSNSFFIKETINEILSNLQTPTETAGFSIDNVAKIIFEVYQSISKRLQIDTMSNNVLAEVIIGGYCPEQNKVRAFLYSPILIKNKPSKYKYEEVLCNHGETIFIGNGSDSAKELFKNDYYSITSRDNSLDILKKVIDSREKKTIGVGGAIQLGTFSSVSPSPFSVSGYTEKNEDGERKIYIRGLDVTEDSFFSGCGDLSVGYKYIAPFDFFRRGLLDDAVKAFRGQLVLGLESGTDIPIELKRFPVDASEVSSVMLMTYLYDRGFSDIHYINGGNEMRWRG